LSNEPESTQSIDDQVVASIFHWSLAVLVAVALFDLAILWKYPFPVASPLVRGVFYSAVGLIIVVAAIVCAFLGYRIVSLRFVRRSWHVYTIFLPLMAVVGSIAWLYLLSPA
jgi:uncharacterized membrane protein